MVALNINKIIESKSEIRIIKSINENKRYRKYESKDN